MNRDEHAPVHLTDTANDRFKQRHRRVRWIAIGLAVAVHIVLLFLTPVFRVDFGSLDAAGPRLVVTFAEWSPPACGADCMPGQTPHDSTSPAPRLTNGGDLNRRLSRWYPRVMWRHREPSSATYLVVVSRSGRVRDLRVLETSGDAAEDAIGQLVRHARFERGRAFVATVRVNVEVPR